MALIAPSAGADMFASRNRSMDNVPCCSVLGRLPRIPPVDARMSGRSSSTRMSSSSSASTSSGAGRFFDGCSFVLAFRAHSGVGLIFSNCLRSRRSYSRPPIASSVGASRSLRSRLLLFRETSSEASSGSTHAGALRAAVCVDAEVEAIGPSSSSSSSESSFSSSASSASCSWSSDPRTSSSMSRSGTTGAGSAVASSTKKS